MTIDRRQVYRLDEKNPLSRTSADDQPQRAIGADGDDVAHMGYSVLSRSNPRSYFPERAGIAPPVRDEPNCSPDEEQTWGTFNAP